MSLSEGESEGETFDGREHEARLKAYWDKKARRRSSVEKEPVGDSLELRENARIKMMLSKNGESRILFSDWVVKINRRGRTQDRWLIVTDGAVYNIDPATSKLKRRIALANLSRVSTSLLADNFFILHVPSEYDYVYVSGRKRDVVSVLLGAYRKATGEELELSMQNIIDYQIDRDQQRRLAFQQGDDGVYTKMYAKKAR